MPAGVRRNGAVRGAIVSPPGYDGLIAWVKVRTADTSEGVEIDEEPVMDDHFLPRRPRPWIAAGHQRSCTRLQESIRLGCRTVAAQEP